MAEGDAEGVVGGVSAKEEEVTPELTRLRQLIERMERLVNKTDLKEKVRLEFEDYIANIECEVEPNKIVHKQYWCRMHRVMFESEKSPDYCPCGDTLFHVFRELKSFLKDLK
jgi:hypothetical protein